MVILVTVTIFSTIFSIAGIFYAYFGYPLILQFLVRKGHTARSLVPRAPKEALTRQSPKSMSVIVAARNEAAVIEEKLRSTLALRTPVDCEFVEVFVASDASDDGTDELARNIAGVKVVRSESRKGKEFAQKSAAEQARGDVIVFTDAKVRLAEDALERFLPYFSDPSVGAVSSTDQVESSAESASGEGMYVRYEMWLRELETRFGSVVGLSGSCFAVRRELCSAMRTDIPSDFSMLLETQTQGLRGVSAPDVVCWYRAVRSEEEEFQRKIRTVLRGMTALFECGHVLNPKEFGLFSWQVISHKLFRWLVPWFMVVATAGSLQLADDSLFFLLAALGSVSFILAAVVGYVEPAWRKFPFVRIPLFFCVANLAIAVAWIRYFRGDRAVTWQPSAKPT